MPRQVYPTPFIIKPPDDFVEIHPELRRLSHAISIQFAGGVQKKEGMTAVVTEENLQVMGRSLWEALPKNVKDEFERAHGRAAATILPIIIETDKADEQALPWETLHHPEHGFLGKHAGFTLSRRMGEPTASPLKPEKGPLRVLLFTSLPDDVNPEHGRLNVEEEQIQVQEALMPWVSKGMVELEMPDDGRFSTLKELLNSFHPHVLFLSGHGQFHHEPHTGESPYGEFLFEGEPGDSDPIKEDAIAQALVGMGVQVVVLSACESGKAASDALTNGLAQRLGTLGIPHVIGMRETIYDQAGTKFTCTLCDALAKQEQVDFALQLARITIQTPFKDISRRETEVAGAAENLSFGQWCLPMLISPNPASPVIDWNFPPSKFEIDYTSKSLSNITLPPRFVGRRAEMRKYKSEIFKGTIQKLYITGPGGQGKTSLAGKLALDLRQARGYHVFAWSARLENSWRDFEFDMELALDDSRAKKYDHFRPRFKNDQDRAQFMIDLLLEQFNGRVIFFLDNLETVQDPNTFEIRDETIAAWIEAAQNTKGLTLLCTSRWQLPGWDGEHLPLSHASYGDFLQIAQQLTLRGQLQRSFLEDRKRLRVVYDSLGGNSRGLEFFAAATLNMESAEEEAFLAKLAQTKTEIQANMAIEVIYTHLPDTAKTFLSRLPAHQEPVPAEGLIKLGLDLPEDPQVLLDRLLTVSLLEAQYNPAYDVVQYQCSPLVTDWLREKNLLDKDSKRLDVVADYHLYLRKNERFTLSQSIITHNALHRAGRTAEADRLTLDYIAGPFTLAGLYATLLTEWLPSVCNSDDLHVRGEALGQTGKLLVHIGQYQAALSYLKQSLAIQQQIGDKAGEGTTLNNISQIFKAQGDYETALSYLKQSLAIRQQIDDKAGEGATLNNISGIYQAQGDYETALSYLKQSLAIQQQIGDKAGEGTALGNIATIFIRLGDYDTSLNYVKQALTIFQQIGDKKDEGTALNDISQIYHAQGDYETALSYLKQSLAIRQQIGDKAGEGQSLNNISQIFKAQGDYETALSYLKQSLAIQQQIGNKAGEGATLNNIATSYHAQGDYETALSYLKQSLAIRQQIGDKAGEGATLNNISGIYQAQGDYETALSYLKQSLTIRQQIGDKAGYCVTLFNIGQIYAQNKQIQEAANAWVSVYKIAKPMGLANVMKALAELAPQLGLPEGLEGWEMLSKRMNDEGGRMKEGQESEESELEQVEGFVHALVQAVREKSENASKYFESVSKMAVDSEALPDYRELGKVLQKYMSGVKNPDLSGLPKEMAEIVQKAING